METTLWRFQQKQTKQAWAIAISTDHIDSDLYHLKHSDRCVGTRANDPHRPCWKNVSIIGCQGCANQGGLQETAKYLMGEILRRESR